MPQSANVLRLRRCVDVPNPAPAASGQAKCDCCSAECWLSKGSVDVLRTFPLLNLLCTNCADSVMKVAHIRVGVPRTPADLERTLAVLHAVGERTAKEGQS